jgi:N-carbamoylputrescine amidase
METPRAKGPANNINFLSMKKNTSKVTVALLQMSMEASPKANVKKTVSMIEKAAKKGADIVVTPELFTTLYFPQIHDQKCFELAETIPGPSSQAIAQATRKNKVTVVASLFEKRTAGLYHNTALTFNAKGEMIDLYRKMHIPHDPSFYEKYYFSPGDTGFRTVETQRAKIGTLICWDQWYPEGARLTALQGAEVLFYPTAIGWFKSDKEPWKTEMHNAWETIQRSHAIANGVFVGSVNRVGTEDGLVFWGQSFIADPFGRVLARGSKDKEEIVMAECDLDLIRDTRENWPFLRDRRIDAYDGLTQRFGK